MLRLEGFHQLVRTADAVLVEAPAPVGAGEPGAPLPLDLRLAPLRGDKRIILFGNAIDQEAEYTSSNDR